MILGCIQEERTADGGQIELTKTRVAILEYPHHQLPPPLALPITRTSQYDDIYSKFLSKEELTAFVLEDS